MNIFKHISLAALLLPLCSVQVCAQEPQQQELEQRIKNYLDQHAATGQFMGSVLIKKDGEKVFKEAYGWENTDTKKKNTLQTKFWLESVSKEITALAIVQLSEKGLLDLDDPFTKYLPDYYPNKDRSNVEKDGVAVTVRHLLEHKSGIPEFNTKTFVDGEGNVQLISSEDAFLHAIKDKPLIAVPGTTYEYSNTGYNLLACIVGKASGKRFDVYLKKNIFRPLGMKHSGCARIGKPGKGFAVGYDLDFATGEYEKKQSNNIDFPVGNGNIYSTVKDMALWNEALYSEKLLKNWDYILSLWGSSEVCGYKGWYAFGAGDEDGYRAFTARFVDSDNKTVKASITVLNNCGAAEWMTIAKNLSSIVFGEEAAPVEKKHIVTLSDDEIKKYVGMYKKPNGKLCKISAQGKDKLFVELPFEGQAPVMRIYPATKTEFFLQQIPEQKIHFRETNSVVELVIHPGLFGDEEDIVAVKISDKKEGKVVVLNGISGAGKSTLVKELLPSLKGTTEVISYDQTLCDMIRKKFTDEKGKAPSSDSELYAYWAELDKQDSKTLDKICDQAGSQIYVNIRNAYLNGKIVIVDTVMTTKDESEFFLKTLNDLPIFFILVYCPLEQLFKNLMKRNQSEDKKEQRDLDQPSYQFFELYKKREKDSQPCIDILKKDQVDWVVSRIKETAKTTIKDDVELAKFIKSIDERMPSIYKNLELDKNKEIEITPAFDHDLVVNTGVLTPTQAAQKIIHFLENKTPCKAMQQNLQQLKLA